MQPLDINGSTFVWFVVVEKKSILPKILAENVLMNVRMWEK